MPSAYNAHEVLRETFARLRARARTPIELVLRDLPSEAEQGRGGTAPVLHREAPCGS